MKNYYLNAFRIESDGSWNECKIMGRCSFESINSALRSFYYNVGFLSSSLSNSYVCYFDDEDFIKKVRISNSETTIMVYLLKVS